MCRLTSVLIVAALARVAGGQGIEDLEPPDLLNLWIEPTQIDCSFSDQVITVHWELTDNLAGVVQEGTKIRLESPTGNISGNLWRTVNLGDLVSGTPQHGFYETEFTMPRYTEIGEWRMTGLWMRDAVGNLRNHFNSLPDYLATLATQGIESPTVIVGPAPEPSTLALLAVAVVGLLAGGRRRGKW